MKRAWIGLGLWVIAGCGDDPVDVETLPEDLNAALQGIYEEDESVPGIVLSLRLGDFRFEGAAGDSAFEQGSPLEAGDLFRIASVTKTFTSAAALVYVEQGALDLDDPIVGLLTSETVGMLEDGGYDPSSITLRQLLNHTAGIFDYTEAASFYDTILEDPSHRWTRTEQVALAMAEGAPLNAPGAEYHYGDTHYILAGEILEQASGLPLAGALRSSLGFEALGMNDTFLESLESPSSSDALDGLTDPYIGDMDTRDWDPSWDLYGGGGLVSSAGDLVRFFDALFDTEDGIFASETTLETMLEMPDEGLEEFSGMDGGMGLNRFYYDDVECFAGLGFFTTWAVHCPELDLTFASTENQSEPDEPDRIVLEVLALVR